MLLLISSHVRSRQQVSSEPKDHRGQWSNFSAVSITHRALDRRLPFQVSTQLTVSPSQHVRYPYPVNLSSGGQVRNLLQKRRPISQLSQPKLGVDKGPIHLVEAGLIEQLQEIGWKVNFDGHHQFEEIQAASDPPIGILKNPRLVSRVAQSVANVVGGHAKNGQLPVTLGGDHSLVRTKFHPFSVHS